jgi:hypothetical protein
MLFPQSRRTAFDQTARAEAPVKALLAANAMDPNDVAPVDPVGDPLIASAGPIQPGRLFDVTLFGIAASIYRREPLAAGAAVGPGGGLVASVAIDLGRSLTTAMRGPSRLALVAATMTAVGLGRGRPRDRQRGDTGRQD